MATEIRQHQQQQKQQQNSTLWPCSINKSWAVEDDWDRHRATITRLYSHENRTLGEVMAIMEKQFGFRATPKMYKSRFKRWGLWKYNKGGSDSADRKAATAKKTVEKSVETMAPPPFSTTTANMPAISSTALVVAHCVESPASQPTNRAVLHLQRHQARRAMIRRSKSHVDPEAHQRAQAVAAQAYPSPEQASPPSFPRANPTTSSSITLASPAAAMRSVPNLMYIRGLSPFQEENTYRVIHDYYERSFCDRKWTFPVVIRTGPKRAGGGRFSFGGAAPLGTMLAPHLPPEVEETRPGEEVGAEQKEETLWCGESLPASTRRQLTDFHARFRVAVNLLIRSQSPSEPTDKKAASGAEGIKMMRIIFAQLPEVLGAEDPVLPQYMLDMVKKLRHANLAFLEWQLLRHLHGLTQSSAQQVSRATSLIWHMLGTSSSWSGGVGGSVVDTAACAELMVRQFERHLGPFHRETVELVEWWNLHRYHTFEAREEGLRALYARLSAALGPGVFDARHLNILMNLASHLRRNDRIPQAAAVLASVLDDSVRCEILRRNPETEVTYNFYWLMGKVRSRQGDHADAERNFRIAVEIAGKIKDQRGSELLSGMLALEQCLRDQGQDGEADRAAEMRRVVIREQLAKVGEKENSA